MRRDSPLRTPPTRDRAIRARSVAIAGLAALVLAACPSLDAVAQTPGLPVLQDPFTSPGSGAGLNYGHGDAFSAVSLAGSWTPNSNRFQVSAGIGAVSPHGISAHGVGVGSRMSVPVRTRWTGPTSALGAAVFGGVGGSWWSGAGELRVPVGVAVGYRMRLGESRALAAYVAPYFQWSRRTGDREAARVAPVPADEDGAGEDRQDSDLARAAVGVDVTLTQRVTLALGYDLGEGADPGRPGPTSGILGVGLGWSF